MKRLYRRLIFRFSVSILTPRQLDSRWASATAALPLRCPLAFLNQLPELARLAQLRVLGDRQFAAEEKIAKRVFVQNAMHFDAFLGLGEVNTVILRAIAIQLFPLALDHAKAPGIELIQIFGQNLKLGQQLKLQPFW